MRWLASALLIAGAPAFAIDIRIYSEHSASREVLSPAVVRNSHASFRVVVTAPPGTLYFLAVQTNPVDLLGIRLYRQPAKHSDHLIEERNISFLAGVIPSAGRSVYLLDLWVPPGARPGPVRVEALVKTAYWKVAPMEVRILPVAAAAVPTCVGPCGKSVSATETLLSALAGNLARCSPPLTGIESVTARNSVEDAALARTLPAISREIVFRAILTSLLHWQGSYIVPSPGELYVPIRQLLYREAMRSATDQAIRGTRTPAPDSR